MAEELRQNIAHEIEDAFAETPYPGDNNIGWGCGREGAKFEEVLRGKHWQDLSVEFIRKHENEVPCMTPDGFRYYMPAFMLATILHYDEVNTLPDNLIGSLWSPYQGDTYEHFLVMVSKL